jgi:hypothetical protein
VVVRRLSLLAARRGAGAAADFLAWESLYFQGQRAAVIPVGGVLVFRAQNVEQRVEAGIREVRRVHVPSHLWRFGSFDQNMTETKDENMIVLTPNDGGQPSPDVAARIALDVGPLRLVRWRFSPPPVGQRGFQ